MNWLVLCAGKTLLVLVFLSLFVLVPCVLLFNVHMPVKYMVDE